MICDQNKVPDGCYYDTGTPLVDRSLGLLHNHTIDVITNLSETYHYMRPKNNCLFPVTRPTLI